jgi:uncharacterized protein (DUF302 family)
MIYSTTSSKAVNEIKEEMEEKAKKHGFGLLKSYEFNTMLEEKGFPIKRNIAVFELCNPAGAQAALDNYPEISVYLPCRISVYEKDGQTILSTIALEEIMGTSTALTDDFKELMGDIYNRLKALMNE